MAATFQPLDHPVVKINGQNAGNKVEPTTGGFHSAPILAITRNQAVITMTSTYAGAEIRYTWTNRNPTLRSKKYDVPLVLVRNMSGGDNCVLKTKVYWRGQKSSVFTTEFRIIDPEE
jgi:hypothetical protein